MLHPSYAELIKVVNGETEGDTPAVNSRYSIVLATAKRARQLIDGRRPLSRPAIDKPLSIAVDELSKGLIRIEPEERAQEQEELEIGEMEQEAAAEELQTVEEMQTAEEVQTPEESGTPEEA